MNFSQGKLADSLVEEMLELIHKYDETLYTATAIGCLESVSYTHLTLPTIYSV